MTRELITVGPRSTVREAAKLLSGNGFTALPVVDDDGALVGIVSEADVLRDRIPGDPRGLVGAGWDRWDHHDPGGDGAPCPATVGEIMSSPVTAVPTGADVAEVAKIMLGQRIRCLPVIDGARLVGVVTRRDLVRCLARSDDAIATDVRRRLEVYGGADRWRVAVRQGRVSISDSHDDPVDAHVAKIIARAVPGVEFAKVVVPAGAADEAGPRRSRR